MGFQDVAFLPFRASYSTTFLLNCRRGESLETITCLKTVVVDSKGMLPVEYFCSSKALSLCQSNFMKIIRLLQR